ncbi:MAG: rane carboxypeptidase (penicillin-binding protein) [Actinomycetia bacterium]|nr:rane carboxypeptidase (penicillin-binding protein) [Actinomycetes bacterium]
MKIARYFLRFTAIVVVGALALGGCLALVAPAFRTIIFGTTAYGSILPKLTRPAERSIVYDKYGNPIDTLYSEDRQPISLKEIPQTLIDAVLSIEDHNFYHHHGVDAKATLRALIDNLQNGHVQQGGSTITQQLVKNTLIKHPKRDVQRKIQEAFLATRLEKELTKSQILERYLNVIYLGNGAYGMRSAAERYFGKEPKQLTLAECAMLGGLIQSPEQLNPITHPHAARLRRATVLDAMVRYRKIPRGAAQFAKRQVLPTQSHNTNPTGNPDNSYFLSWVLNHILLQDDPKVKGDVGEVLKTNYTSPYDAVFRGGLKIYTTFDPFMQNRALDAVRANLPASKFTASMVALDNSNGAVVAMVGGPNFQVSKFNLATQGIRQTGSTFKGITLATALEAGYSPNDTVNGSSLLYPQPGQAPWNLHTDCGAPVESLSTAIAKSDNCAFARTLISLGPGHSGTDGAQRVVAMAGRLGIDTSKLSAVPSLTLGTSPTSVLEMAGAYSVFANNGIRRAPMFVTKVVGPDGKVVFQDLGAGTPVLSPQVASTETQMLRGVITGGTGTNANIGRPAAGKTGTTTDHADAWFVGYTPQYTAAVWMGDPLGEFSMTPVLGPVFGGKFPALMWHSFMQSAVANLPALDFVPPNPGLWPSPQFIDENGRSLHYVPPPPPTFATTPPPVTTATTNPKNRPPGTTTPDTKKPPKTNPPGTTSPTGGGPGGGGGP